MLSLEVFKNIYETSFYFNIFCLVTGLFFYKKLNNKSLVILFYLFFSISFDFAGGRFVRNIFELKTNIHFSNYWTITEFIILFFFYFKIKGLKNKIVIQLTILLLFVISYFLFFIYIGSFYEFNNYHQVFEAIYFSSMSIVLYYSFLNNLEIKLLSNSLFWQNTGLFIYFTGNILIFLMIDFYYGGDFKFFRISWGIHNLLTIVKSICFLFAFIMNAKYSKINQ